MNTNMCSYTKPHIPDSPRLFLTSIFSGHVYYASSYVQSDGCQKRYLAK